MMINKLGSLEFLKNLPGQEILGPFHRSLFSPDLLRLLGTNSFLASQFGKGEIVPYFVETISN